MSDLRVIDDLSDLREKMRVKVCPKCGETATWICTNEGCGLCFRNDCCKCFGDAA